MKWRLGIEFALLQATYYTTKSSPKSGCPKRYYHTMRELFLFSLTGLLLLGTFSCKKDKPLDIQTTPNINFESPEVGQISKYILLQGENIKHTANTFFEYLPDTLVAEIIEKEDDKYLIKEYLTEGSASLNGENYVSFADSTLYYNLIKSDTALTIQNLHFRIKSRLFFYPNQEDGIRNREFHDLPVNMETWKTSLPFTTQYIECYVENLQLLEREYPHLNVQINNLPMRSGSSGYTHVYSMKHGLVRSARYSDLTGKGFGWDLISN